jgi:hypothetical protein
MTGSAQYGPFQTLAGETRVAVAGDWHGSTLWLQTIIPAIHRTAPDIQTILHVGDFGIYPDRRGKGFLNAVDRSCLAVGIQRVLVTPGNHDHWPRLDQRFASRPGQPAQLSKTVWALPRGYRFDLADRSIMSFGGAASLDAARRRMSETWWPTEMPTDDDVSVAVAGGPVDILITHEAIEGGTSRVQSILDENPMNWDSQALAYSALSRLRATEVWAGVRPHVLAHGHIHVADAAALPNGQRVYSLAANGQKKNVGLLQLSDLAWTWIN